MNELLDFLINDFNLPSDTAKEVIKYYQLESLKKRVLVSRQGGRLDKVYIIKRGYLRFFSNKGSKEVTHWIFGKNQLITDVGNYFLDHSTKWNIQTLCDTEVYSLTKRNYEELRKVIPEWDEYERKFILKLLSALENRVYTLISMTAEERYKFLFASDSEIFNKLPLQYVASMLGMSPETLSRIRAKEIS